MMAQRDLGQPQIIYLLYNYFSFVPFSTFHLVAMMGTSESYYSSITVSV